MSKAPIALFVYNRPNHMRRTIEALQNNALSRESDLLIFSDAPKNSNDSPGVNEVRSYLHEISGFKTVTTIKREKNWGLAASIIDGVTRICREHGRVIVLEDDLVVSPCFLAYMNDALERYKDEERVMQISGYMFPVREPIDESALFLPFTTSWGWATWSRGWEKFDTEAQGYALLKNDREMRKAFDLGGAYPYFKMLESQLKGEIDSWAIRWYLSVFLAHGLILYPPKSLVENIGMDGSGTHSGDADFTQQSLADFRGDIKLPETIEVSHLNKEVTETLRKASKRSFVSKIKGIFQ